VATPNNSFTKFLLEHRRSHPSLMYFHGADLNLDRYEKWHTAKLRVLLMFMLSGAQKVRSNALSSLNNIFHINNQDDVFVDMCFYPDGVFELLSEHNFPCLTGNVSHESWDKYDIIAVSHGIQSEVLNLVPMYEQSLFPLTMEQRDKANAPIVLYGGCLSAIGSTIFMGKVHKDGEYLGKGYFDIGLTGAGEVHAPYFLSKAIEFKQTHGSIKDNRKGFIEECMKDPFLVQYMLIPNKYEVTFKSDNATVSKIKYLDPRTPKQIKVGRLVEPNMAGFAPKFLPVDGAEVGSQDIQISAGCSSGCCTFCYVGIMTGGWSELSIDQLREHIRTSKKYAAPTAYELFSFNTIYHSRYIDCLNEVAKNSLNLNMKNVRTDILAESPEFFKTARKLGIFKISAAVEGVGERLRNNIFNKNLSRETWMKCADNVLKEGLISYKFGMIYTGWETEDDKAQFISELDEIMAIRKKNNSNAAIMISWMPLIVYDMTPLRWMPRETAKIAYYGEKSLDWFFEARETRFKDMIKTKVSLVGKGSYVEQLLLDLGFAGSSLLVTAAKYKFSYTRSFRQKHIDQLVKILAENNLAPDWFFHERPFDTIFSSDIIGVNTPDTIERWKEQHKAQDFRTPLCLKTSANVNPKCRPECGFCQTAEQKKQRVARKIESENSLDDVLLTLSNNRLRDRHKLILEVRPGYEFYSKITLAHFAASQFLRRDDSLLDSYHSLSKTSLQWLLRDSLPAPFNGRFCFDIHWKSAVDIDKLRSYIDAINADVNTFKIVAIHPSFAENSPSKSDIAVYLCHLPNMTVSLFQEKLADFDWEVPVTVKGFNPTDTKVEHYPQLKDNIIAVNQGPNLLVGMAVDAAKSPFFILDSIFGRAVGHHFKTATVSQVDYGKTIDAVCQCGCGQSRIYSYFSDSVTKYSPKCQLKRLLAGQQRQQMALASL